MIETGAKFPIGPTPRARELNMAYRAVIRLVDGDEAPEIECWCEYAPEPIVYAQYSHEVNQHRKVQEGACFFALRAELHLHH